MCSSDLAAFSWALLIGAILPRQLPALLVSGCIAVAVGFALPAAFPYGDGWRWIPVAELSDPSTQHASRFGSSGFLDRNGAVLTYREALAAAPDPLDAGAADTWIYDHLTPVVLVVPGSESVGVVLREAALLGTAGIACLVTAAVIVDRRRPF